MGKITEVKFNKNYTKAKIYIDGDFFDELTDEAIVLHGLREGVDVDERQLNIALYDSQIRTAFDWLAGYLSNYPASANRCKTKLAEKGYAACVIDAAIEKAKEYKYIDDEQLAVQLATSYLSKGSIRQARDKMLNMELPLSLINETLRQLGEDAELNSAIKVGNSWSRYKDLTDKATKDKFLRYMSGKGYSFSLASKVLKQIMEGNNED